MVTEAAVMEMPLNSTSRHKRGGFFLKLTGSPDEHFMQAYLIKSVLSVHAQIVVEN
jgi:hypothetical protein